VPGKQRSTPAPLIQRNKPATRLLSQQIQRLLPLLSSVVQKFVGIEGVLQALGNFGQVLRYLIATGRVSTDISATCEAPFRYTKTTRRNVAYSTHSPMLSEISSGN
jgi:hypothetical protein